MLAIVVWILAAAGAATIAGRLLASLEPALHLSDELDPLRSLASGASFGPPDWTNSAAPSETGLHAESLLRLSGSVGGVHSLMQADARAGPAESFRAREQ